jgi:hypothetical protein
MAKHLICLDQRIPEKEARIGLVLLIGGSETEPNKCKDRDKQIQSLTAVRIRTLEGDVEWKVPNGETPSVVTAFAHLGQTFLDTLQIDKILLTPSSLLTINKRKF